MSDKIDFCRIIETTLRLRGINQSKTEIDRIGAEVQAAYNQYGDHAAIDCMYGYLKPLCQN